MAGERDTSRTADAKAACRPFEVPTADELTALDALRAIKERVRDLKKRLSGISASPDGAPAKERADIEEEMARLKVAWKAWEAKREDAARERMIRLGHLKP